MNKIKAAIPVITLMLLAFCLQPVQSQSLRIVSINTFNGAITGTALGGATIALQNEYDEYPLRFGLGLGTILGLGTGFYDLSRSTADYGYHVSGLISSANASGTIILLDTFYGAATGSIVGMAISLMSRDSDILKGLQYGSGAGAWIGFAFGLVDAFAISTAGNYESFYDEYARRPSTPPTGLVEIRSANDQYTLGFLDPMLFRSYHGYGNADLALQSHWGIAFTQLNIVF